jgi:hypothetical protein
MYGCCHPNAGAWFQAKLNKIIAVIPTVAPSRSSSRTRSLCEILRTAGSRGTEGKIKIERMARQNNAMPNDQKAHGHHKSAQRPANVPPATPPPVQCQKSQKNRLMNTYQVRMLQTARRPCPSSFPRYKSRPANRVHLAVV